jgi:L-iditol 2-dehydrogenase
MRALVLHAPGAFGVEPNWPLPEPKPGWARVRVAYAGICGSDLPRFMSTGSYTHPAVLGHEFAGVVDAPAPGSRRFRGGEPVAVLPIIPCGECEGCVRFGPFHCTRYNFLGSRCDGGFAEYCLAPEENLLPLPPGVPLLHGAFAEPLAVALHVVRRARFDGGKALVFGAGPIGLLVAAWLRALGASRVVVADVRPESLDLARRSGMEAIDARLPELAALPPMDLCVEAAGASAALLAAIERNRSQGTIVVVGRDTQDTALPLRSFETLMRREITLGGCWGYDLGGDRELLLTALGEDRFPLDVLTTHRVGLEEAPQMIRAMAERRLYTCKVMIEMGRGEGCVKRET